MNSARVEMRRLWIAAVLGASILGLTAWRMATRRDAASQAATQPATTQPAQVSLGGMTMGGTWSVKLRRLPAGANAEQIEQSIGTLLARLDGELSLYKPDSALCRFNDYRGEEWFAVPAEFAEVVGAALLVSEQTGGAFDVTVTPLVNLWGFGPMKSGGQLGKIPSDAEIAAALAQVGYQRLECRFEPPALRKHQPQLAIDLGGIAKGFAADKVAAHLDALGAADYLISIGGELRARGSSHGDAGWHVGIETPTPDTRRILRQLDLRNASLSTSGDYRNFFEVSGHHLSHEIDPHSGRPVEGGPASVSVVHASGTYADAMATALMVLPLDKSFSLAEQLGLAVLFVSRGNEKFETRETAAFSKLTH